MNSFEKLLNKNIFVTGASGLIGSHICSELFKLNCKVVICERDTVPLSRLYLENLHQKLVITRGNLEDYSYLRRIINDYEIDLVFHLAAQTQVRNAYLNPTETFESNIKGTWSLLEAIRQSNFNTKIIVASSDKAYGESRELPYTEETFPLPIFPYDVSKRCVELLANSYNKTYGLPVVITRLCNVYGGGDFNFNRLIPYLIKQMLNNKEIILRSDGSPLREYLYVEDSASAYLTLGANVEKINGEIFNIGSGNVLSVNQVFEIIASKLNYSKKPIYKIDNTYEIKNQYLSSEKIKKYLGWKAAYSFEKGIEKTINWYKRFINYL